MFKSNLYDAVQRAFNCGCDQGEVAEQLREMVAKVECGKIKHVDEISEPNNNRDTCPVASLGASCIGRTLIT